MKLIPRTRTKRLQAIVVVVAVIMGLVVAITGKQYYDSNNAPLAVCGDFRDALGLYPGNKVNVLGVQVGNIISIDPATDHVTVHMTVDRKVTLPADLAAITVTNSIVTDRHVELSPYKGGGTFDYRHCIPLARTKTPVGFTEDLRAMTKFGDDLTAKPANSLVEEPAPTILGDSLASIAKQVRDTAQPLNGSIRNVSDILGDSAMAMNFVLKNILARIKEITTGLNTSQYGLQYAVDAITDTENIANRVLPDVVEIIHDIAVWVPPLVNLLLYKWGRPLVALMDAIVPPIDKALKDVPAMSAFLGQIPPAMQGALRMFNQNLGGGMLHYTPPTIGMSGQLAQDVCGVAKAWYPPCNRDFSQGATMDLGIMQLLLSSAGAR